MFLEKKASPVTSSSMTSDSCSIRMKASTPCATSALLLGAAMTVTVMSAVAGEAQWKKHTAWEGGHVNTVAAGDFTKDGRPDLIFNSGGKTILLTAPDWNPVVIEGEKKYDFIHSESFDVDGDGDLDFIGARYNNPGLIAWLEQPAKPLEEKWVVRTVSSKLNGIHGLLVGDVNKDGRTDLLANSAQPVGTGYPNSLAWFSVPADPRGTAEWKPNVFARHDAAGLTHYLGVGDVNGDGRPDACTGAKGSPALTGNWFAWWEAPEDPQDVWTKHLIAKHQKGATNIHPGDLNGDGKTDFFASRGHGTGVIWFEGPDWKEHVIHATLERPHSLIVLDMDADGDLDGATCAFGSKEAWWFENDGKGSFTNHLVATDQSAYDIRAHDMDMDGDLDLVIAGQSSRNVVWCENPAK